jgi:hypothetical protein
MMKGGCRGGAACAWDLLETDKHRHGVARKACKYAIQTQRDAHERDDKRRRAHR